MTEKEVEENCECGLTEAGLWDEALFDQWGCDCNMPRFCNWFGRLDHTGDNDAA